MRKSLGLLDRVYDNLRQFFFFKRKRKFNEISSGQSDNSITTEPVQYPATTAFEYQPPKLVKKLKTDSSNDQTSFSKLNLQIQSTQNMTKQNDEQLPQTLINEDLELSKLNQISSETNPVGVFLQLDNTGYDQIDQSSQSQQPHNRITQINSLKTHLQQEQIQQANWLKHWESIKRTFMETKQEEEKLDNYGLDELAQQMAELSLQNKKEMEVEQEKIRIQRRIQSIKERLITPSFCEMLTSNQLTEILVVFDKKGNTNELVVKHSHILQTLSYANFQTLFNTSWLNDEIINAYATLIQLFFKNRLDEIREEESKSIQKESNEYVERQKNAVQVQTVLIMSSFIYPIIQKKEFTKICRILNKNNVSENSLILVPLNIHGNHWIFVEINLQTHCLVYYDSLLSNGQHSLQWKIVLQEFKEALEYYQQQYFHLGITGKQQNGYDCGVFMLRGMLARVMEIIESAKRSNKNENNKQQQQFDISIFTQQAHMLFYRYQIAAELIKGTLIGLKQ